MAFEKKVPEWNAAGSEPPASLKNSGFTAGYKPPAAYFNWFWHNMSEAVKELQGATPEDIGARPNTWLPTPEDIGAFGAFGLYSGTDLNSFTKLGACVIMNDAIANKPSASTGFGLVWNTRGYGTTYLVQNFYDAATRKMSYRSFTDGSWKDWKQIATTDYAVNKAGDTMTGDLHAYSGAASASFYADRDCSGNKYSANVGVFPEGLPYFGRRKDNSLQSYIILEADKLRFNSETAGIYSTVLHTGNKPSGSYTGNGSATSRTVAVGGIGEVLTITSDTGMALVTNRGAICLNRQTGALSGLKSYEVNYQGGVLTIATSSDFVNKSSLGYWYQVL